MRGYGFRGLEKINAHLVGATSKNFDLPKLRIISFGQFLLDATAQVKGKRILGNDMIEVVKDDRTLLKVRAIVLGDKDDKVVVGFAALAGLGEIQTVCSMGGDSELPINDVKISSDDDGQFKVEIIRGELTEEARHPDGVLTFNARSTIGGFSFSAGSQEHAEFALAEGDANIFYPIYSLILRDLTTILISSGHVIRCLETIPQ